MLLALRAELGDRGRQAWNPIAGPTWLGCLLIGQRSADLPLAREALPRGSWLAISSPPSSGARALVGE